MANNGVISLASARLALGRAGGSPDH